MHQPLAYRAEIDGLRAFSVIAVFLYHLNQNWLPSGYLGVDVFFVISGFLITSIIAKDCASGNFSFKEFYWRRARRILPAMLTVSVLTGIAAYFILFPDEMRAAAKACKKALLCSANYHFAKERGYFDPNAEANPFLHTWSLGLEEQFYFIFPLLAVLAYARGWFKARYVGAFVVLGFVVSCFMTFKQPNRAFFVLESRAWELGAGAWLAIAASRGTLPDWMKHQAISVLSVVLLCISVIFFSSGSLTPAPMALSAVLGAVLFIGSRAGGDGAFLNKVFSSPPMRFTGRISYSLYLIHWPLIVFVRSWYGEFSLNLAAVVFGVSVVLAVAMYHLIEKPFRRRGNPVVFFILIAATAGSLLWGANFANERRGVVNPAKRLALSEILPEWNDPRVRQESPYLIGRTDVEPSVGLWGDSHSLAMVVALDAELKRRGLCGQVWAHPGNLPAVGVFVRGEKVNINQDAVDALSRPSIKQVIIVSRWSSYIKGKSEDSKYGPRILGAETPVDAIALLRAGLETGFSKLSVPGREIVVVFPVPEIETHVPYLIARRIRMGEDVTELFLTNDYGQRNDLTIQLLNEMCAKYALVPVYPDKLFMQDGMVQVSRGGKALYSDDDHLSVLGSTLLLKEILDRVTMPPLIDL